MLDSAVRKVRVQVGGRHEPSSSSSSLTATAPQTNTSDLPAGVSLEETSQKTLAELCDAIHQRKRGSAREEGLATAQPLQAVKKPRQTSSSSSSSSSAAATAAAKALTAASDNTKKDLGPRVEVIDGKIVIKESSLTIDPLGENKDDQEYEEVVEGLHASSRYSSYSHRKQGRTWGLEETRLFYQALRQCGTEFSMMQSFFPHRTRRELKLKFFRLTLWLNGYDGTELVPFEVSLGKEIVIPPKEEQSNTAEIPSISATAGNEGDPQQAIQTESSVVQAIILAEV
eukprot:scaffold4347_cov269-Ochromonas_danica.AAC.3